jgi:hypothetical protein
MQISLNGVMKAFLGFSAERQGQLMVLRTFVVVDEYGSTGTRFCYPEKSVNRMEGEKVTSEPGVRRPQEG